MAGHWGGRHPNRANPTTATVRPSLAAAAPEGPRTPCDLPQLRVRNAPTAASRTTLTRCSATAATWHRTCTSR